MAKGYANLDTDMPAVARATGGTTQDLTYYKPYFEKGNVSQLVVLSIFILGVIITFAAPEGSNTSEFGEYVMSFGLFGFAGGFTNFIAVTMLFERIPGVYGSGVIPNRYEEIRGGVKDTIMATFFDREFLKNYLATKLKDVAGGFDVLAQVDTMVNSEDFGKMVEEKLESLKELPMMATMIAAGMQPASLKPMVVPFVANLGKDLAPLLVEKLTDAAIMIDINDVRKEIETYMEERVKTLSEKKVVTLLNFVIRDHLGWLVLYGSLFGSIIGLISHAIGLVPDYRHEPFAP